MTTPLKTLLPMLLSLELPFFTAVRELLKTEPLKSRLLPVALTATPNVVPAKGSVEVPEQVSVPLLIVPPLKVALAEMVSVKPLQSSMPEVIVNFLIVVFAASTGRFVCVIIETVSLVEGGPEILPDQLLAVAQSVLVAPVQVKLPAKEKWVRNKRSNNKCFVRYNEGVASLSANAVPSLAMTTHFWEFSLVNEIGVLIVFIGLILVGD